MADDLKNVKDMLPADRDHPWAWRGGVVLEPVGSKPKGADRTPEDLYRHAAAAEASARATFGMSDHAGLDRLSTERASWHAFNVVVNDDHGLSRRIGFDRRAYLVGTAAVVSGLLVMVGTIWLYTRPAAPHVAIDNSWCSGFSGLSCTKNDAGK